jgi:hypothetical protein
MGHGAALDRLAGFVERVCEDIRDQGELALRL